MAPKKTPPLAVALVTRLNRRLELALNAHKGWAPPGRPVVNLYDLEGTARVSRVWLSADADKRVAEIITARPEFGVDDLDGEFLAQLKSAAVANTSRHEPARRDRSLSRESERSRSRSTSPDPLGLELDIVGESEAFVSKTTAASEPRFPRRRHAQPQQLSPSKGWSSYELGRVGDRHARTREVSFEESRQKEAELAAALERERAARERLEERQRELERVAWQLQGVVNQVSGELNQQAVGTLQQALLELLEQEHDPDQHADESGEPLVIDIGSDIPGLAGDITGCEDITGPLVIAAQGR